jgi:CO/xanthine dehydrogenase Mo-binding subunit
MAIEKTRYIGEIVAAVAADTEDAARAACGLIKIKYTPLKPFFEIEESLNDVGANEKIHSNTKQNNNIHKIAELRFGNRRRSRKFGLC